MGLEKPAQFPFQVVAGVAECGELFLVCAVYGRRVGQAPMNPFGCSREDGTMLGGAIANRDDRIKSLPLEFHHGFRAVRGNIQPDFAHRFDGQWIYGGWLRAGAANFQAILTQMAQQPLGHLAPR